MRIGPFVLAVVGLSGCAIAADPLPQYMQDAPRTEEDVRRAVAEIRKELGPDFMIDSVDGLFFLAVNDGPNEFNRCKETIERMVRFLYRDTFVKKPVRPIRVYCFRDAERYEDYCRKAYGRAPGTPFGFYMPSERKMVMNISTGTGTLAHELVHPLLSEDFPDVPAWFNEGFASLYEQSRLTTEGRMEGLVNWRLRALREARRSGRAIRLADLLATSTAQFYDERQGLNYATARYLCKWLQDEKKLETFYREFKASADRDPTGRATLEQVAGMPVAELDRVFERWVLDLR